MPASTRSTARITPPTARAYISTSSLVLRLAWAWLSKNVVKNLLERDFRHLALLGRLGGFQQRGRLEAEHAREHRVREGLALGVVLHHRVVVGLAREGDLVLGGGEFLLNLQDV